MERLIVWHRWLPPAESGPDALLRAREAQERCRRKLESEGARVLATLGGTVVCEVDPAYIAPVVEGCLELLTTFEKLEGDVGSLSIALSIGTMTDESARSEIGQAAEPQTDSDVLDRAQALANQAQAGELVLDREAHASMAATFLFARELSAGPGIDGEVVDRWLPRRRDCRAGLALLAPPILPASAQAPFQLLRQVTLSKGRHRLLVVGPYGAGVTSWMGHLANEAKPALWLHVSAVAAPLAPLSGLAYALARLHSQGRGPEHLLDLTDEPDKRAIDVLGQVRQGLAIGRREVINALRHLIVRMPELHGTRAWISVSPVPLVDPASVGVIADAIRECPADHLLVLRMALDGKPPEALVRGGALAEIRLLPLSQSEARALAQSMLGRDASSDIARRAAAMGGTTALGIAEAVRVLVSSGDVIHDGEVFRWRRGPAGRVNTIPVDEMIEERVDQLDNDARRLLETLASVPDPAETELVDEVRRADGVSDAAYSVAIEQLIAESLIERSHAALAMTSQVRTVVEHCMPPARLSEVNRYIAEALSKRTPDKDQFSHATLGYYMARGGNPEAAVDVLLEAARSAGQLGFVRSGVRLAAAAVECDPTGEAHERAALIAQTMSARAATPKKAPEAAEAAQAARMEPPSEPALPSAQPERTFSAQAMQHAIEAIVARDFDAVERCLELLVAAGKDGPAVDRLRAMTLLSKGDPAAARQALDRTRPRAQQPEQDSARAALAMALVLLDGGEIGSAVREALRALSRARSTADVRGEQASLHTLAACYKRLNRQADARTLEQVAQAAHSRAGLQAVPAGGSSRP